MIIIIIRKNKKKELFNLHKASDTINRKMLLQKHKATKFSEKKISGLSPTNV